MSRNMTLSTAVLWAAAILAAALLQAPRTLTLLVLPLLAVVALLPAMARAVGPGCRRARPG